MVLALLEEASTAEQGEKKQEEPNKVIPLDPADPKKVVTIGGGLDAK